MLSLRLEDAVCGPGVDRARCRVEQGWDPQRVRERDADHGDWRAGRILFVDFLDRYQEELIDRLDGME